MQVRKVQIGSGGSGGSGGPVHIQIDGGTMQSMMGSGNWIYIAIIIVLLIIGIVLVALTIREYNRQKKNKKQP